MIILITGTPGSGKTLYALNYVKAWAEREKRLVYYSGVADLKLPWTNVDEVQEHPGAENWYRNVPDGQIVLIDECQRVFRPRGSGASVPTCVSALETHRHKGVDLVLITQHPMLMDSNIRRLVGRHFHVFRKFGLQGATVYEWGEAKDPTPSARRVAVQHKFRYPAESFAWYKSAEVHTHKRRVPMRVWVMFAMPLVIAACAWGFWHVMGPRLHRQEASPAVAGGGGTLVPVGGAARGSKPLSRSEWFELRAPRLSTMAMTAPVYDKLAEPTRVPVPAACIASATRCICESQDATPMQEVDERTCRSIVNGGLFLAFDPEGHRDASGERAPERLPDAEAARVRELASATAPPGASGGSDGVAVASYNPVPLSAPGTSPVPLSAPTGSVTAKQR